MSQVIDVPIGEVLHVPWDERCGEYLICGSVVWKVNEPYGGEDPVDVRDIEDWAEQWVGVHYARDCVRWWDIQGNHAGGTWTRAGLVWSE